MKTVVTLGLSVLLVAVAGSFVRADDKKDANKEKIVGTWLLVKTEGDTPEGLTIEFTKDGKLSVKIKAGDMDFNITGTYTLDGNKLNVKVKFGDEEKEEKLTIKEVSADKLVMTDPKGKTDEFKKKK